MEGTIKLGGRARGWLDRPAAVHPEKYTLRRDGQLRRVGRYAGRFTPTLQLLDLPAGADGAEVSLAAARARCEFRTGAAAGAGAGSEAGGGSEGGAGSEAGAGVGAGGEDQDTWQDQKIVIMRDMLGWLRRIESNQDAVWQVPRCQGDREEWGSRPMPYPSGGDDARRGVLVISAGDIISIPTGGTLRDVRQVLMLRKLRAASLAEARARESG